MEEKKFFTSANDLFRKFDGLQARMQAMEKQRVKPHTVYDPTKYIRGNKLYIDPKNIANFNAKDIPNVKKDSNGNQVGFTYEDYLNRYKSKPKDLNENNNNQDSFPINQNNNYSYDQYKMQKNPDESFNQNQNNNNYNNNYQNNDFNNPNNNDHVLNSFMNPRNTNSSKMNTSTMNNNNNFNMNTNMGYSINNNNNPNQSFNEFSILSNQNNTNNGLNTSNMNVKSTYVVTQKDFTDQAQDTFNPYGDLTFNDFQPTFKPNPNYMSQMPTSNQKMGNSFVNHNSGFPNKSEVNRNQSNNNMEFPK